MGLLVGFGFIQHGLSKLSRGPDVFAGILQQLGVPLPHLAAWLTIGTELAGGLAFFAWSFRSLGKHSHGCGLARRDGHCPSAVRI
jgi:putative oxidoreductase